MAFALFSTVQTDGSGTPPTAMASKSSQRRRFLPVVAQLGSAPADPPVPLPLLLDALVVVDPVDVEPLAEVDTLEAALPPPEPAVACPFVLFPQPAPAAGTSARSQIKSRRVFIKPSVTHWARGEAPRVRGRG